MKEKKKNGAIDHTGSTFDSFLEEEGIREEVEAVAVKRVDFMAACRSYEKEKENQTGSRQGTKNEPVPA